MFAAFIIFLPFAILTAFSFKNWQPAWFYVHIAAIMCTVVAGAAGLVVGFMLIIDEYYQVIHKWIGVAIIAALLIQVCVCFTTSAAAAVLTLPPARTFARLCLACPMQQSPASSNTFELCHSGIHAVILLRKHTPLSVAGLSPVSLHAVHGVHTSVHPSWLCQCLPLCSDCVQWV